MIEAQSYAHQNRPRELASSNGFAVEYDPIVTDQEIFDEVVSYLGEYRFSLQEYDYDLEFSEGALKDSIRGESMSVKAARSVRERMMRGESINREAAEVNGLGFLDKQLESAMVGDNIVWASPPGEISDGYGNYGFFFIGQVRSKIDNRKQIEMSALRVEKPTLAGFNNAFKTLTDIDIDARKPEDFLKFPVVIQKDIPELFITETLAQNFPFKKDPEQRKVFDIAMTRIQPKIHDFINYVKWGTREEKRKAFHALENYSLQIKKELENGKVSVYEAEVKFDEFVNTLGYEPPKVAGSCPIKSNNSFSGGLDNLNSFLEDDRFECPSCHQKADGPVGDKCPNCGITKEEYAKKAPSGEIC